MYLYGYRVLFPEQEILFYFHHSFSESNLFQKKIENGIKLIYSIASSKLSPFQKFFLKNSKFGTCLHEFFTLSTRDVLVPVPAPENQRNRCECLFRNRKVTRNKALIFHRDVNRIAYHSIQNRLKS